MEPYDPPEARSASSYNWTGYGFPPSVPKRKWSAKKIFHGIVLGVLTGAVLGLVYLNWYEAQVIQAQRHLILEMWKYIVQSCPTEMLQ